MVQALPISVQALEARRRALGISIPALAARSGVAAPTLKRILAGQLGEASFSKVTAIIEALGGTLALRELDPDELCRRQARLKAEQIARLVQGTSALEAQAVDDETYNRLVEKSYHELLAGSRRRLWSA